MRPGPVSTSTFDFGILPRMKRNVVLVAVLLGAAGGGAGTLRDGAPGRAIDPPASPVDRRVCTAEETVSLVPLGDAQLRITLFPWVE